MAYFPMFLDIKDADCLVVGGGQVAYQKVKVLLDFEAKVQVLAPVVCDEITELVGEFQGRVTIIAKDYQDSDISNQILVVAATDDKQLNHFIAIRCRELKIMVNAVDQVEDCGFIFPAFVKEQSLIAAFSSSGKSPLIAQELKSKGRQILTPLLAEINEQLGQVREEVKVRVNVASARKNVYKKILDMAQEKNRILTNQEIEEIIKKYEI